MATSAAITIDVDSLRFYREIHGLPDGPDEDDPIYTIAMPRFWELIEEASVPAEEAVPGSSPEEDDEEER